MWESTAFPWHDPPAEHSLSPSGVPGEGPRCDSSPRPGFALYLSLGVAQHSGLVTARPCFPPPAPAGTSPALPTHAPFLRLEQRQSVAELPWKPTLPSGTATSA